jgi:hypothetical protein
MIRLTWRQFRFQASVALVGLLAVGLALLVTGPHLVDLNDSYLASCARGACSSDQNPVQSADLKLQFFFTTVLIVIPALIGLFWAAPLIARELETGTFRLAWTQGVTRRRWLAFKVGLIGLGAMAFAGILSWWVSWWFSPIDTANANIYSVGEFGQRGVVSIGYAAFAVALGAAVGVIIRRTLPAMGTTLATFVAARLATTFWIRPRLIPTTQSTFSMSQLGRVGLQVTNSGLTLTAAPTIPNGWLYSASIVNNSGQALAPQVVSRMCPGLDQAFATPVFANGGKSVRSSNLEILNACITRISAQYHILASYQPSSHYWPMQWAETGLYLAGALALVGLTFWWVRHRLV